MKLLVIISLCICILQTGATSAEVKTKMTPKANAVVPPQKTEVYYQQQNQQQAQQQNHQQNHQQNNQLNHQQTQHVQNDYNMPPVQQIMQKPLFIPHQATTMLIIAQPAYIPHQILYGNSGTVQQQLLNYFHNNPQAKYQLLYGGYQPHPTPQPFVHHNHIAAPSIAAYQFVPHPAYNGYNNILAAPTQVSFTHPPFQHQNHIGPGHYVHPLHANQFTHLTQIPHFSTPIKSVPPIITGFENFTPEQQAQIKAQLGAHLGPAITTIPAQNANQLTAQTPPSLNVNEHLHGQDNNKNGPQAASSNYSPSIIYRTQYTKG